MCHRDVAERTLIFFLLMYTLHISHERAPQPRNN